MKRLFRTINLILLHHQPLQLVARAVKGKMGKLDE